MTYEGASDIILELLKISTVKSVYQKLDSALLAEWAKKLIVKKYNNWEYEVANYIFRTPELIKIFNAVDLIDLLINKGEVGHLGSWPNIENELLRQGLINQFFAADNKSLRGVLKHLNNASSKKIIEKELERRESLSLDRIYLSVSTFFQQVEKQQPEYDQASTTHKLNIVF